jgi:hypothetical protein
MVPLSLVERGRREEWDCGRSGETNQATVRLRITTLSYRHFMDYFMDYLDILVRRRGLSLLRRSLNRWIGGGRITL